MRINAIIPIDMRIHKENSMFGNIEIAAVMIKIRSEILSIIAPVLLSTCKYLASLPSIISEIPHHRYIDQKPVLP